MPIPDEEIDKHLNFLLTNSDPGDVLGAMHVVAAPRGPRGRPDIDKRETSVFVMACDNTMAPEDFVILTIANTALRFKDSGHTPLWAGLKQEMLSVEPFDDQARKLVSAGRSLSEHPRGGEITVVYAAASDGRRWLGRRWLTGPHAGTVEEPTIIGGPQNQNEGFGYMSRAIRKLVGIYER